LSAGENVMKHLGKLLAALGLAIISFGIWEWQYNISPKAQPLGVDLDRLEVGEAYTSGTLWKIGAHVRCYPLRVAVRDGPSVLTSSEIEGPVRAYYYPVVSLRHPYLYAYFRYAHVKKGTTVVGPTQTPAPTSNPGYSFADAEDPRREIPPNWVPTPNEESGYTVEGTDARLSEFAVLVKTDPDVPSWPTPPTGYAGFKLDWIQGTIVGRASDLEGEVRKYFAKTYPKLDLSKVWVLEQEKELSRAPRLLAIFGLGLLLCVAGILTWGEKAPSNAPSDALG
jgi:hypothetical protein